MAGDISDVDRTIVVGVDGSAPSKAALRWAAHLAQLDGSTVWAVAAWEYPSLSGSAQVVQAENIERAASRMLTATVAEVFGPEPEVEVRESVQPGHPAEVLLDAAAHAQLLVVGSRGHGVLTGPLLGSVSQHCAQHAACPVVITRGES